MSRRLENVRAVLAREGLDALLVTQLQNMRYLSGFTGSAGILIVTPELALLATDFRYYEQVKLQAPGWRLVEVKGAGYQTLTETVAATRS